MSEVGTVIATRAPAPAMGLTKRQSEALAFIRWFIEANGYSPSNEEIRQSLGLSAKSAVHRVVHGLRERGAIDFLDRRTRSIIVLHPVDA